MSQDTETQQGADQSAQTEQETPPEFAAFQALLDRGITPEALAEQANAIRNEARTLEVDGIVAALQGRAQREDVAQLEGYTHYPAVVTAVETALRGVQENEALAMSITQSGRCPLDAVVLQIVNALPADARLALDAPERPPREMRQTHPERVQGAAVRTEPIAPGTDVTEEQIEALDRALS